MDAFWTQNCVCLISIAYAYELFRLWKQKKFFKLFFELLLFVYIFEFLFAVVRGNLSGELELQS